MHEHFGKIALEIFKKENQIKNKLTYFSKYPDLIATPMGPKSISCLKKNIKICLKYISGYLQGKGVVAIDNCLEDLSSFEISRAQVWQWRRHNILLDTADIVNNELIQKIIDEETEEIHREIQSSILEKDRLVKQEEYLLSSKKLLLSLMLSDELDQYFGDFINSVSI